METVKINPAEIPDEVYEIGCRLISKYIRKFYENPENRKAYEEWMQTEEGKRANLTKEERAKFDAERSGRKNDTTISMKGGENNAI